MIWAPLRLTVTRWAVDLNRCDNQAFPAFWSLHETCPSSVGLGLTHNFVINSCYKEACLTGMRQTSSQKGRKFQKKEEKSLISYTFAIWWKTENGGNPPKGGKISSLTDCWVLICALNFKIDGDDHTEIQKLWQMVKICPVLFKKGDNWVTANQNKTKKIWMIASSKRGRCGQSYRLPFFSECSPRTGIAMDNLVITRTVIIIHSLKF